MNFGTLGTPYYLGTINILIANTVAKTMGANTATAGVVQLNGTGASNLILSNASTSLFTLAPLAGGSSTGMSLRLNALSSEISVTGTGGITISAPITETTGSAKAISKTGTGTLLLSGANTFTGGIDLNAGTLQASTGGTSGTHLGTGSLRFGTGAATFNVNTASAATISNAIVLGTSNSTATYSFTKTSGSTVTYSGDISGTNANATLFFNSGTGGDSTTQYILSGNNTFAAANININRGVLVVSSATALGASTNRVTLDSNVNNTIGNLSFRVGGTFANPITITGAGAYPIGVTGTNIVTLTGAITANSTFIKLDTGTLILNGANTFTAATNVNGGTLAIGATGTLLSTNITVASGAIFDVSASSGFTIGNSRTLTAGRTTSPANDVVGNITIGDGTGGNFNVAGTGTAGTATFGNNLALNSGTVRFDLSNTTGSGNDAVAIAGNLTLSGTNIVAINTTGTSLANGNYTLFTYSGTLSGGAANLTQNAGTRQTLAFDTATAGSVLLNVSGSAANLTWVGDSANNIWDLATTANFSGGGGDNRFYNLDSVTFDGTGVGGATAVTLNSTVSPASVLVTGSQDYTISGTGGIAGGTGLTKSGNGLLILATANTYSGGTTINSGALQLGAGGTVGSLVGNVTNNGNLSFNRSNASTFAGIISGTGNVSQLGSGTLAFTGTNTYSGSTTISGGGTISLASDATLGTAPGSATAGQLVLNNGTLLASAGFTLNANRGIAVGPTSGNGAGTINVAAGTLIYNGIIADNGGTGALVKAGTGTLQLGGANSFSGGITHSAGIINFTQASGLGTGTFTFNGYNRLQANVADGQSMTVANNIVLTTMTGGGENELLRIGDGSPTVGTTLRLTGLISGGQSTSTYTLLDSDQTGNHNHTLVLDNASNSFSGTVEIWRGTLAFTSDGALGNTANTIRVNAGSFNGGLRFDANNISLASTRTINLLGSEVINSQANNGTIASLITGSTLRKNGSGILTLTGNNTHIGGTTVAAGTLLANGQSGSNSGTGTGAVTVASGATLGGNGRVAGATTVTNGGNITAGTAAGSSALALGNNLTLASGATYNAKLFGTGATDISLLNVTNTATINATGSLLTLDLSALSQADVDTLRAGGNQTYTVLAATTLNGSFSASNFSIANLGNFSTGEWTLSGSPAANTVQLNFTPVPEPGTLLGLGAIGLGIAAAVRRRRSLVSAPATAS